MVKRRVFVSVPMNSNLDRRQRAVVDTVIDSISAAGFEPQRFLYSGLPTSIGWNFQAVDDVMRRCIGAVIFAFPRRRLKDEDKIIWLPTEWNHYEGAVANTLKLPILIITEKGTADTGITYTGGGIPICFKPPDSGAEWVKDDEMFQGHYKAWIDKLRGRHDVFLGYCSKAKEAANAINIFLTNQGVKVLDWVKFSAGGNILNEIEKACSLTSAGIFLFTKDDELQNVGGDRAAPRDNVVFEAGYFTQSKGRERILIVRQVGAKMPADIGGNIYLSLKSKSDISPIETQLLHFIDNRL